MAITEATRPEIPVVGRITSNCTSVITNCCSRSSNNSGGGTEFSSEGWSIKTSFAADGNANVDAAAAAIAAASESSPSTNSGTQGNGGSAPSKTTPVSPTTAATAAAAAESTAAAAAIAAATAPPTWEEDLQAQMQEWFRDSDWVDEPPSITVTMGSGAVCQLDCTATVALPPDAVFNVVRDPHNRRVFKNVKSVIDVRVVSDDGAVQHVEMNMTFLWRLPAISGTFTAHVLMIQDRPNRMLSYELTRPGFMKKFQGFWKVEPLVVPSSPAISGAYESDDRGSQGSSSSSIPPTQPGGPSNPSNISKSNSHDSSDSNSSSSNKPGDGSNDPSQSPISILSYESCPDLLAFAESAETAGTAPGRASQAVACLGSALDSDDANIVVSGVVTAAAAAGGRGGGGGGTVPPALSPAARRVASRIVLHQIAQPSVAPPPVFRKCLKGILQTSTRDMLRDFQTEAARIRSSRSEERLGETEEGGKGAQVARERAEKRTASFLHKETLRASGLTPGSKVIGSGGFAANLGKKTGMNLVKGAMSRSKKGLTSLAKAGRK